MRGVICYFLGCACMSAKWFQPCPTLCYPKDCVAHQAPLSMGFSRQEHCSGLPCPPPEDLPNPEIEHASLALAGKFFTTSAARLRKETSNWKVLRVGDCQGGGKVKLQSSCILCPAAKTLHLCPTLS